MKRFGLKVSFAGPGAGGFRFNGTPQTPAALRWRKWPATAGDCGGD